MIDGSSDKTQNKKKQKTKNKKQEQKLLLFDKLAVDVLLLLNRVLMHIKNQGQK